MTRDYGLDYGLGDMRKWVEGEPSWLPTELHCPNCSALLCQVKVRMANFPLMKRSAEGNYLGCPACTYASRMLIIGRRT